MSENTKLHELVDGVHELSAAVAANEDAVRRMGVTQNTLARARRRHRLAITLTCIGLALDLLLSVAVLIAYQKQACVQRNLAYRQQYADRNFDAEFAKVSGQIKGIDELTTNVRGGIDQFKKASQMYLDRIAAIHQEQVNHPLGSC